MLHHVWKRLHYCSLTIQVTRKHYSGNEETTKMLRPLKKQRNELSRPFPDDLRQPRRSKGILLGLAFSVLRESWQTHLKQAL